MKITVTDEDILNGRALETRQCPIALAAKRASGSTDVCVGSRWIFIAGVRYKLPIHAQDFVLAYDGHEMVEPMEFDLC